jgi:hypothetical protein
MDFDVNGVDVDCKWSRRFGGWQIPPEAVGHICLLIHGDDITGEIAVGLLRIREEILVGGNRDGKRTIQSPGGIGEIRWLVAPGTPIPENFLMGLRQQDRDAILAPRGGDARAMELFRRCEGMVIYRHTIEAIGQQLDEARRFRGETRAKLLEQGFEVLNGHWKPQRRRAMELGGIEISNGSQWVCLPAIRWFEPCTQGGIGANADRGVAGISQDLQRTDHRGTPSPQASAKIC